MSTVEKILRNGPASSRELTAVLGISQPTLSRRIRDLARSVLVIDKGRSTRYALRREVAGESYFPLYQIDKLGKAHLFATLYSLYPADSCAVFDEQSGEWQLYDGLPWYLNDLRPVGFLGRAWGKAVARQLKLPEDVLQWNEEQRLVALCHYGEDMSGDLLPGAESYQRWLTRAAEIPVPMAGKAKYYATLSARALAGN
ncbi:putative DNA-binding transcriptional regulator [Serratia fonticola]|uniref:Putative DNA-binding transcriptional regulator n=1 Tax=Serratia fonticola TaxID=47917 RepID=A0A3S5AH16_SERFO|nr:putative DNA-binding transcriptional regulator [Serratia fonticola]